MIPVNTPDLSGNEKKYLAHCIDSGWISNEGGFVRQLEENMAQLTHQHEGIAVSNGSVALDIAVAALQLKAGDEVIMPSFTIISCVAAVVRVGAIPVFVDVDPHTWNMDVTHIADKITARTKAIMVVHIYGLPVDMEPVVALVKEHNLRLIEDAAEAHGQYYRDQPCGSFGDVATFSFYPNKHITCGEGGIVVTSDPELAKQCRSLRNLCFKQPRFVHDELGFNGRMSNLQAAVGVAQSERLAKFIERKKVMGNRYQEAFADLPYVTLPLTSTPYAENHYWVLGMVIDAQTGVTAEQIMTKLSESGIGVRPFFYGLHEQPVLKQYPWFVPEVLPVTEHLARQGFYIPSGLGLSEQDQQRVIQQVKEVWHASF